MWPWVYRKHHSILSEMTKHSKSTLSRLDRHGEEVELGQLPHLLVGVDNGPSPLNLTSLDNGGEITFLPLDGAYWPSSVLCHGCISLVTPCASLEKGTGHWRWNGFTTELGTGPRQPYLLSGSGTTWALETQFWNLPSPNAAHFIQFI